MTRLLVTLIDGTADVYSLRAEAYVLDGKAVLYVIERGTPIRTVNYPLANVLKWEWQEGV